MAEVRWDAVVLADGVVLPSAATIWTAGFGVPDLAARSGLRTDAMGRLLTDETLTSIDDERIVAAGDAAAPSGQPLRMSCQAAGPLGAQAANTVLSRIAGDEPAAIDQAFVGQCISLGRTHATIQFARTDDTPVNVYIGGRVGGVDQGGRLQGHAVGDPAARPRKPGSYFWLKGGKRPAQSPADEAGRRRDDASTDRRRARRTVHPAAAAAVHHRLRDPGLGNRSRRRACRTAICGGRTVDLATVRDTKSYLAQLVTRQALNALRAECPPARGVRRPVAARAAAARRAGRRRPMSFWPSRFRWRCWCCWRR